MGSGFFVDKNIVATTRRTIHVRKGREKTSESSERRAAKDDQDVSDDLLPPLTRSPQSLRR